MKKWTPWLIIGGGVIIFLWFSREQLGLGQSVKTPYLVPQPLQPTLQTGANPGADQNLNEQPNMIGIPPNGPAQANTPSWVFDWWRTPTSIASPHNTQVQDTGSTNFPSHTYTAQ